ncbi:MAG: lamin tail domain-containing protein [Candidatus Niyogibacteria bacterium]|nr:lamin tail domain-containing protein [Candidatus Niyogibacteria bacterium]
MKYLLSAFIVVFVAMPTSVFAVCSDTGATVVYVNGVMNSKQDAIDSTNALQQKFQKTFNNLDITFITGYNPSHLAGLGDLMQSAAQMIDNSISDHDLNTILMQIQPEVTTRKILLVGHSQGTFYTNSLYTYLINHGVPKESIAVYNIATPASEVAGNGSHLTSSNDSLIRAVTALAQKLQILLPLPTNIDVPIYRDDAQSDYPGHDFIRAYIAGASDQIVSDVLRALNTLTAEASAETCFTAPQPTMGYKAEDMAFAIIDSVADTSTGAIVSITGGAYQAGSMLASAAMDITSALGSVINSIIKFPSHILNSSPTANLADLPAGQAGPAAITLDQNGPQAEPQIAAPIPLTAPSQPTDSASQFPSEMGAPMANLDTERPSEGVVVPQVVIANAAPNTYHDYGGGRTDSSVATAATTALSQVATSSDSNLETEFPSDITAPQAPSITSPTNFAATLTNSSVTFQGTAEASSTISTDFYSATTTVNTAGDWQMILNFPQGTSTLKFFATDAAGNQSSSTEIILFTDSIPPTAPIFAIDECAASLSQSGCLVATTTLHLQWSGDVLDTNYYELSYGGTVSTTTETSKILQLNDNTDYTFSLRARDRAGNWSNAISTTVIINTMPVIINEVAWAGTATSANDEWVELYNRTSLAIELDKWVLQAQDGVPYINLSGSILPKSYYLIERTNDNTISDIAADLITPFSGLGSGSGLGNAGETLLLSYKPNGAATTTMDQTPANVYSWLGGDDYYKRTMERYDPDISGALTSSWSTNNGLIRNGKDANGAQLSGTPKARNSVNYLIAKGNSYVSGNIVLTKSNSPYLVNNILQVFQPGSSLTIEPGVIIKFFNDAGFQINGLVDARGTVEEPVVFTSFNDDAYGGDLNGDATSTSSVAGSWYGVRVDAGNGSAVFDYAIFRYAGKYYYGTGAPMTNLYVKDAPVIISHSLFEYSKVYGLQVVNANAQISNNTFRFNNQDNDPAGINAGVYVSGGVPQIVANSFSQNKRGLYLSSSQGMISDNIFNSNTSDAVYSYGLISSFSNNQGSNNAINGLVISGTITPTNSFSTTTLIANSLPYVIFSSSYDYPKVSASSTLVIEKGVVIKSRGQLQIEGKLVMNGENPNDIILTSLYDDTAGGDTNNDATSTTPGPGSGSGIAVKSGGSLAGKGFSIRYGGSNAYGGIDSAGLRLFSGSSAQISQAVFDNNYPYGIYTESGSALSLKNSVLKNHRYTTNVTFGWGYGTALKSYSATTILADLAFTNNYTGISGSSVFGWITDNLAFSDNVATTSPANLF